MPDHVNPSSFLGRISVFFKNYLYYAGLEKYLMKDIFVAGIYQWVLRKLAFQSYYTGD
jgi:hypothetical protein